MLPIKISEPEEAEFVPPGLQAASPVWLGKRFSGRPLAAPPAPLEGPKPARIGAMLVILGVLFLALLLGKAVLGALL